MPVQCAPTNRSRRCTAATSFRPRNRSRFSPSNSGLGERAPRPWRLVTGRGNAKDNIRRAVAVVCIRPRANNSAKTALKITRRVAAASHPDRGGPLTLQLEQAVLCSTRGVGGGRGRGAAGGGVQGGRGGAGETAGRTNKHAQGQTKTQTKTQTKALAKQVHAYTLRDVESVDL